MDGIAIKLIHDSASTRANRSPARHAKAVKPVGSVACSFERMLRALALFVRQISAVLFLCVSMAVSRRAEGHEDQRQEGEHEGLDEADEDFQEVERNRADTDRDERHH